MIKRFALSLLLLSLCAVTSVQAKTIIWVAENLSADSDTSHQTAADVMDDWQPWIDKLTAAGYTLNGKGDGYWNALTDAKRDELNAADLVIVSRAINSSTFSTDAAEIARWNGLTVPVICSSPYVMRKASGTAARWNWVNNSDSSLPQNNGDQGSPKLQAVVPSHIIFTGVTLDSTNQVQIADPTIGSGNCTFLPIKTAGNGTVLAKTVTTTLVEDWVWIAEWQKGDEFYASGGTKAGGHRMYFTAGARETPTGGTFKEAHFNLTDEGWKLFLNTVKYMIGDPVDPTFASAPSPTDKAQDVTFKTGMTWTPGTGMTAHDVYLGTDQASVTNATRANPLGVLVATGTPTASFTPTKRLDFGRTYYWRVDEVGGSKKGEVWSFTVEPKSYVLGVKPTATASASLSSDYDPNNTVNGSGMSGANNELTDSTGKNMWVTPKGINGGKLPQWIKYEFDRVYKLDQMWVWNYNISTEDESGIGAKDVTIEYSVDGNNWAPLGNYQFADGTCLDNYAHNTEVGFKGASAKFVRLTVTSSWISTNQAGLSEVRFFYIPVLAREPKPANNSTNVAPTTPLSWRTGREAVQHQVYLGADPNALTLAGTSATTTFSPTNLVVATKYYWRVDEVNSAETPTLWAGDVWSFTTPDSLAIDDMESYTDVKGQAIFNIWTDGYNTGTNGALVGYDPPTACMEKAIIHGGKQAMPFRYGQTSASVSEAKLAFTTPQDWTRNGVTTLTLFMYGNPTNAAGSLYFKINDVQVATYANSSTVTIPYWVPWNIPLASISGVNLKAVNSFTIGLTGGAGGGMLFIDDIGLYRTAASVATEQLFMEAEATTTTAVNLAPWASADSASASGGKYLTTPSSATASSTAPPTTGVLTYDFTVKGGTYKVWIRMGPITSATTDSLWIRIKDATMNVAGNATNVGWILCNNLYTQPGYSGWHWGVVWDDEHTDTPVQFTLPAGKHTLEIGYRELQVPVDAILVTNNLVQ
jgi:hypothetical protein